VSERHFKKSVVAELVNDNPPEEMNLVLACGDLNGDGRPDFVISGRGGRMVWLENRGESTPWPQHVIDPNVDRLERGGVLADLTGDGRLDVINGGDWRSDAVYWWENPGKPGVPWTKRLIARTGKCQVHDVAVGRVTADGALSLIFTNQIGGTDIYRLPVPADPRVSPWPDREVVAVDKTEPNPFVADGRQPEEGLAIGDVDGDGVDELVCGTWWYKHTEQGWRAHRLASGYITTKVAIADLDGDGRNEIVLSEGDPCVYGRMGGGRLAWFKPRNDDVTDLWEEHVLADGLLDAHSLDVGDVFGNGHMDILVGEVGVAERPGRLVRIIHSQAERLGNRIGRPIYLFRSTKPTYALRAPRVLVLQNDGRAQFTEHLVDEGTGIHDGLLVDVLGRGVLDIVGKPLHGPEKWNVHVWYNDGA
jgi:hypothetical protein